MSQKTITQWENVLRHCVTACQKSSPDSFLISLVRLVEKINQFILSTDFNVNCSESFESPGSIDSFLSTSKSILSEICQSIQARRLLQIHLDCIKEHHDTIESIVSTLGDKKYASFEWRNSSLLTAIENGYWIFIEDADQCPPAVLDRLNPLFERAPLASEHTKFPKTSTYPDKVLLAEAPAKDDGSPVFLRPHPDFRMCFAVSSQHGRRSHLGLSRALIDRSLRIYLN